MLVAAATARAPGVVLATVLALAFLSDVFDGIVARKLGVATESLRSADSIVDTLFYMAAVIALWLYAPGVILANTTGILTIVILEVARQVLRCRRVCRLDNPFEMAPRHPAYLACRGN